MKLLFLYVLFLISICSNASSGIVNKSVTDPCVDFSEFVCRQWIIENAHKKRNGSLMYANFEETEKLAFEKIKVTFGEYEPNEKSTAGYKAKQFYKSCLKVLEKQPNYSVVHRVQHQVKRILERIPGDLYSLFENDNMEPLKSSFQPLLEETLRTGVNGLFMKIVPKEYYKSTNKTVIKIIQPEFLLPVEYLKNERVIKRYRKKMAHVIREIFQHKYPKWIFHRDSKNLRSIMTIQKHLSQDYSKNKTKERLMKISELQDVCPDINWTQLINRQMYMVKYFVTHDTKVAVDNVDYFYRGCRELNRHLSCFPLRRALYRALIWSIIHNTVISPLSPLTNFNHYSSVNKDYHIINIPYQLPRTSTECLATAMYSIPAPFSRLYILKHFEGTKDQKNIKRIFEEIRAELIDAFNKAWIIPKIRENIQKYLTQVKFFNGYRKEVLDEKLQNKFFSELQITDEFVDNYFNIVRFFHAKQFLKLSKLYELKNFYAYQANGYPEFRFQAMFSVNRQAVYLSAATYAKPFYDNEYTMPMILASFGNVLAHELIHATETKISNMQFNLDDKNKSHKKIHDRFLKSLMCLYKQYSDVIVDGKHLAAGNTFIEDIADNIGFQLVYQIMKKKINQSENLMNISRLYFIKYAQNWCTVLDKNDTKRIIKMDNHSLWFNRINVVLSNIPDFSAAFNCHGYNETNSQMKRRETCRYIEP